MADDIIKILFGAEIGELKDKLGEAAELVHKSAGDMKENMSSAAAQIGEKMESVGKTMSAFVSVPLAGAGAALLEMTKKTAEYGASLEKVAAKTQTGVEAISQLHYAARLSEVGVTSLDNGLKFLAKNMAAAADGVKAPSQAFEKLGIDVDRLKGKKPDEVFLLVADRLKAIEDPAERVRLAMQIFGRAGADLLPMLLKGADGIKTLMEEGVRLGATMSEQDAEAAGALNQNLIRLSETIGGLIRKIGEGFVPVLNDVVKAMVPVMSGVQSVLQWFKNLDTGTKETAVIMATAFGVTGPIVLAVGAMMTMLGTLMAPIMVGGFIVGGIAAGAYTIVKYWGDLKLSASEIWASITGFVAGASQQITGHVIVLYTQVRTYLVDKFNEIVARVKGAIDLVKGYFHDLYESVVGHSDVPDMVDAIGTQMSRLQDVMVVPAQTFTQAVEQTFRGMHSSVQSSIAGVITGAQTMQQALRNVWVSMISDFAALILRQLIDQGIDAFKNLWSAMKGSGSGATGSAAGAAGSAVGTGAQAATQSAFATAVTAFATAVTGLAAAVAAWQASLTVWGASLTVWNASLTTWGTSLVTWGASLPLFDTGVTGMNTAAVGLNASAAALTAAAAALSAAAGAGGGGSGGGGLLGGLLGGGSSGAGGLFSGGGDAIMADAPELIAFAARGWDVPSAAGGLDGKGGTMAILHPREMVLPADLADNVRNMSGGSGGGDLHVHVHAMDSKDVERALSNNSSGLSRAIAKAQRNFTLRQRAGRR